MLSIFEVCLTWSVLTTLLNFTFIQIYEFLMLEGWSFSYSFIYIYIYIYIYSPQTDCFVVSQRFKLESKPTQLYVRLSILPLSQQVTYVSLGTIILYVLTFICLHFSCVCICVNILMYLPALSHEQYMAQVKFNRFHFRVFLLQDHIPCQS